jgi:nucleoside-diphosphate-sugar epimerase
MKILVTGHDGYIGSIMVPMLIAQGHEVIGIDTKFYEKCIFGEHIVKIIETRKDIRDIKKSDLKGYNAIIHLAALSNDPLGDLKPEITYEINYEASVNLAENAKKAGVKRFLLSSTCSVYGGASEGELLTEKSQVNPLTPYADSKVLSEKEIASLADSKFSPTFLRSATAYGVSPKLRSDLVLNNLVGWAYVTGNILLKSDGMAWRPIVHIEDISRAFISVLKSPRELIHNQIFNVGITNENYQIRTLAEIVKDTVLGSKITFAEGAGPDKRSYRVDFTKISKLLQEYKPTWTAKKGAMQLYNAYKKVGMRSEELEGLKYIRLKQLQSLIEKSLVNSNLRWVE